MKLARLHNIIDFPKNEISDIRKRLKEGKRVFTTRIDREQGLYREGQRWRAPWGSWLEVVDVRPYTRLTDHPYYDQLTEFQRDIIREARIYDFVELAEVGAFSV